MNWNDLKFFLAVARAKSLSESARKLGVSTSTVSRRIEVLEADLQSNLFRQVGRVDFGLFASKAYIERHGEPAKAQDLATHRIIGWPEDLNFLTMSAWLQSISAEFHPSLFLDSLTAHLEAARHGYGIAVLPTFAARPEGLHPILRDVPPLKMDLWLLLHDQSPTSPRVRAVYEKLIDILARNKGVLQE